MKKKAIDLRFKDVQVDLKVTFKLGGKDDKHKGRQEKPVPKNNKE